MTDNSDARIDLEMQFSRQPHMDNTCHAPYAPFVECERERGHVDKGGDKHANGWGERRIRWTDEPVGARDEAKEADHA